MGTEKSELFHLVRRPIEGGSIAPVFVAGGSGAVRVGTEWDLAANQDYAIRLTNRAGNAQPMSLAAQWYEESDS